MPEEHIATSILRFFRVDFHFPPSPLSETISPVRLILGTFFNYRDLGGFPRHFAGVFSALRISFVLFSRTIFEIRTDRFSHNDRKVNSVYPEFELRRGLSFIPFSNREY